MTISRPAGASPRPPHGSWPSPLSPEALTERSVSLSEPALDHHAAWWLESRPEEAGRSVLVRCPERGTPVDVPLHLPGPAADSTPDARPLSVRTRVHEYGGASYALGEGIGVVVLAPDSQLAAFAIPADGSAPDGALTPVTDHEGVRYGAPLVDVHHGVVYAVREDHRGGPDSADVRNDLVAVPLDGSAATDDARVRIVLAGHDFVASPALSPDHGALAAIVWDHPAMSWTAGELVVVPLAPDGTPGEEISVAGGGDVAASAPVWGPDGDLLFLDDSSGWTNPYRLEGAAQSLAEGTLDETRLRALHRGATDFGLPQWGLGPRVAGMATEDYVVAVASEDGRRRLVALRRDNGQAEEWTGEFESAGGIDARDGRVLLVAASATQPAAILQLSVADASVRVLRRSAPERQAPEDVSRGEALSWEAPQADGTTATAHGFWYPPRNAAVGLPARDGATTGVTSADGDSPTPVIVRVHGGPTAAVTASYSAEIQFWTTRGIGVLDVNYGGSTGYGRAYQDRLDGKWGLVDVADCVAGARHLVEIGRADPARIAITGGSAGGLTVVAALADSDVFTAGLVQFGVMDLAMLVRDTHKFESHYPEGLVAPWPEGADVYAERSPLGRLGAVTAPILVEQGLEDAIVPPNQSRALAEALRERGVPVALLEYEGEAHGFRREETIRASVTAQLTFLGQVWGFEPAGGLPEVEVENLENL